MTGRILSTLILANFYTLALAGEQSGLEIARTVDRRANDGFGDMSASVRMVLEDGRKRQSVREFDIARLEGKEDGDRVLTVFADPPDVKGAALLTWSHGELPDDQWLYLPVLKRVKRISSENQSGAFMGSEFAYEDFSPQEVADFTYRYLRREPGNETMLVYERRPVELNSGYTRQVVWVDEAEFRVQRIDYYDRKDELLKTLQIDDYGFYVGRYWRAGRMTMRNHQNERITTLIWQDYRFGTGLTERDFTRVAIRRAR